MATVELDNVRKVYPNGFVAVSGATFAAADGELLVLVGPSGCGKSTTLRMIAGLESVTAGTLSIGERVVNDVAPKDRDIAMVFQSYALYPHMSVAENLAFGLKLRGVERGEIARRVAEAAQMLGLDELLERQPRALSGGQRQRVALGRALVRQPKVFLLDEPLSNLDAKLRLSMRVEIARLHRRLRTTMIYVTHDQIEAMTLGQRIVVFNKGAIQQIDTPMNLYTRPANLFVAGFLGSPAMNFFRGTLAADNGLRLVGAGIELPLGGDAEVERRLRPHAGRELVVGLRPEDLRPLGAAETAPASIEAQLDVIEPVGNEVFLNLSCGGTALVARTPMGRGPSAAATTDGRERSLDLPAPGSRMTLAYEPGAAHFFDAHSEQRIG